MLQEAREYLLNQGSPLGLGEERRDCDHHIFDGYAYKKKNKTNTFQIRY